MVKRRRVWVRVRCGNVIYIPFSRERREDVAVAEALGLRADRIASTIITCGNLRSDQYM